MEFKLGYIPDHSKLAAAMIAGEVHWEITDWELLQELVCQLEHSDIDKSTISFVRMQDGTQYDWDMIRCAARDGIECRGIHAPAPAPTPGTNPI